MFTIDTRDGLTGGTFAPPAALAALRRLVTPERILLTMTQARGAFASISLPQGVQPLRSNYSDTLWAEPASIDDLTARAATRAASGGDPIEADTLPLKSMHWQMVWNARTADGVELEYRMVVRLAPRYREGYRPDVGIMSLGGELSQTPTLPPGLTDAALAPKYRAASLTFTAAPKA
jgi:hypothetical protein